MSKDLIICPIDKHQEVFCMKRHFRIIWKNTLDSEKHIAIFMSCMRQDISISCARLATGVLYRFVTVDALCAFCQPLLEDRYRLQ